MELSEAQLQAVAARVAEILRSKSKGVGDLPVASTLDGVISLPAIKMNAGIPEVLEVPIPLLQNIALEAVKEATGDASAAATEATQAAEAAQEATTLVNIAKQATTDATTAANLAKDKANTAADRVDFSISQATAATNSANTATQGALEAATDANRAASAADGIVADADVAIANMRAVEQAMNNKLAEVEDRLVKDCGTFPNPEELRAAHPTGGAGYGALVQSTDTVWSWSTAKKDWMDTDKKGEVTDAQFRAHTENGNVHITADERAKLEGITSKADVTASAINLAAEKATPADSDYFSIFDGALKKLKWSNIKATLTTYFDTLYTKVALYPTTGSNTDGAMTQKAATDSFAKQIDYTSTAEQEVSGMFWAGKQVYYRFFTGVIRYAAYDTVLSFGNVDSVVTYFGDVVGSPPSFLPYGELNFDNIASEFWNVQGGGGIFLLSSKYMGGPYRIGVFYTYH